MARYRLLGINVDSITEEEAYKKIFALTELERPARVVLLDTYLLVKAKLNKELANVINTADLVLPISPGIKSGLNFFKYKLDTVFNYFYFTIRLFTQLSEETKKNIYVLGGKKKVIEKAEKNIRDSFPGIRLMGRYGIDYKKDFEPKLISAMQKVSPSLILVSMKRPKQEKWISANSNKFKTGVFIGVENFVNILGGKEITSSDKINNSKSQSLSNLMKHPHRIFLYIIYFYLLLIYKLFGFK
jgi:N-acetylglucosaminyldiphosphoundecaprenol N-acetyl-beta-D-mannosaminyltransferase